MTLATPRINEFAERLYLRFIRDETLSADAYISSMTVRFMPI